MQAPKNIEDVSIATEHKSSGIGRISCSKSTVRQLARKKLQKYFRHADFQMTTALSNLRRLLAQGLQQESYYSNNYYSNNTFSAEFEKAIICG